MRSMIFSFCLILLTGCGGAEFTFGFLDRCAFSWFGTTLFSSPIQVSLSEIHLDTGVKLDREIIVEGNLLELDPHGAFVIVGDEKARMLVVLSRLGFDSSLSETLVDTAKFRFLGVVKEGQRGLPYFEARSVSVLGG